VSKEEIAVTILVTLPIIFIGNILGPGAYSATSPHKAPAYSLSGRSPEKLRNDAPGNNLP
jgi:hypothetical protein